MAARKTVSDNVKIYLDKGDHLERLYQNELKLVVPEKGLTYKIVEVKDAETVMIDNFTLIKQGDSLHINYLNNAKVQFEGFFSRCVEDNCGVTLPSGNGESFTLKGEDDQGMKLANGSELIYFHGEDRSLMALISKDMILKPVEQCVDLAFQMNQFNKDVLPPENEGTLASGFWGTLLTSSLGLGMSGLVQDSGSIGAKAKEDLARNEAITAEMADLQALDNPDALAVNNPVVEDAGYENIDSDMTSFTPLALLFGGAEVSNQQNTHALYLEQSDDMLFIGPPDLYI